MNTIFALSALLVAISLYEIDVREHLVATGIVYHPDEDHSGINKPIAMESARWKSWHEHFMRWVIFGLDMCALWCLYLKRKYKIKWVNNYLKSLSAVKS